MERINPKRMMKNYQSKFTNKQLKNSLARIQDVVYWTEWINHLGKVGELDKWKKTKKEIIDYLIDLQDSISEIKYEDFSKLEFHHMLKKLLKKMKQDFNEIRKQNRVHENDFDFILSILKGLIKNNKDIIDQLSDEDWVGGNLQDD
jgi:hypothetical protein